jgi:hypothetical protein
MSPLAPPPHRRTSSTCLRREEHILDRRRGPALWERARTRVAARRVEVAWRVEAVPLVVSSGRRLYAGAGGSRKDGGGNGGARGRAAPAGRRRCRRGSRRRAAARCPASGCILPASSVAPHVRLLCHLCPWPWSPFPHSRARTLIRSEPVAGEGEQDGKNDLICTGAEEEDDSG